MAVILESGNTNVGRVAGDYIIKNREMALRQALANQEAQRDRARLELQREQMEQQRRMAADDKLREEARQQAEMKYKYDALRQTAEQAGLEREARGLESAASRKQALELFGMGEAGADRRADRAERSKQAAMDAALERERRAEERLNEIKESNRRDVLDSRAIALREQTEKEAREQQKKDEDANMQARLRAEEFGLGPIPQDASTEGIARLVGVMAANKSKLAAAEKNYNVLQDRLINYTRGLDNPTDAQADIIRQLSEESQAARAHWNDLRRIIGGGGGGGGGGGESTPRVERKPVVVGTPDVSVGNKPERGGTEQQKEELSQALAALKRAHGGAADKAYVAAKTNLNPVFGYGALYRSTDPDASIKKEAAGRKEALEIVKRAFPNESTAEQITILEEMMAKKVRPSEGGFLGFGADPVKRY